MATHSSLPAWKIHGQRTLAAYSSWGCKRVGHDSVTKQQRHPFYWTDSFPFVNEYKDCWKCTKMLITNLHFWWLLFRANHGLSPCWPGPKEISSFPQFSRGSAGLPPTPLYPCPARLNYSEFLLNNGPLFSFPRIIYFRKFAIINSFSAPGGCKTSPSFLLV